VYETVEPVDDHRNRGEIDGGLVTGVDETAGARDDASVRRRFGSQRQRFTIGLEGLDASFFWENFQRDNLVLSLSYGWKVIGVVRDEQGDWKESTYVVGNALPIDVSPATYPSLFAKKELWQDVEVAHSNVTVMCYDFVNADESDLYYVIVELRFRTLGDRTYHDTVKFIAEEHTYEREVKFRLANELKRGYQYRVQRLFEDGTFVDLGWKDATRPFLDVSMTIDELAARHPTTGDTL
jgi:hypothetical protein